MKNTAVGAFHHQGIAPLWHYVHIEVVTRRLGATRQPFDKAQQRVAGVWMAAYPGSIEQHRQRLRVRLCIGGRRYRFTLATTDRREAERFARAKYAELERQHRRQGDEYPGPLRVSELLVRFEGEEV